MGPPFFRVLGDHGLPKHLSYSIPTSLVHIALKVGQISGCGPLLNEYLEFLSNIRSTVSLLVTQDWEIDKMLSEAKEKTTGEIEKRQAQLRLLSAEIVSKIVSGASFLFGSIISALILLILRDFLSAIIDTAINTGGILNKMKQ